MTEVLMTLRKQHTVILICMGLAAMTLVAYWRVKDCGFVRYDDNFYITSNPHIADGLTAENLKWALTSIDADNWHPLTWISYLVDVELSGGVNAGQFHMTNLLIHLANVLLLFLLLRRLTRSTWKSAFVAALFAVHPLHVESVAWIAERKDVLSALFWLVTTWAYVRYTEKPGIARYAPVFVLFALGLMSKPMLVTLPIVLLLLDYWPLRRSHQSAKTTPSTKHRAPWSLIVEKVPLFVLVAASCAITYHAQKMGHAVTAFEAMPLGIRMANAVVAYVLYLWKMVWPAKLAVLYPHPGPRLPITLVAGSAAFLVAMTAIAITSARKRPYLAVGWLWYQVTLIPVIGIIQVGEQAMADRYTYIPLIGIFVMIAWGITESLGVWEKGIDEERENERRRAHSSHHSRPSRFPTNTERRTPGIVLIPIAILAIVTISVLAAMTHRQVVYWKDSVALFQHEIDVAGGTSTAYYNLGGSLYEVQRYHEAVDAYNKAIECDPNYMEAYYNMAVAAYQAEEYDQAWKAVHVAEELGADVQPEFVQALSSRMPDPGR